MIFSIPPFIGTHHAIEPAELQIHMTRATIGQERFSDARGFTVPELLMAIALFATLTAIGAVGFTTASQSIRGTSGMQQVITQLRTARDLAISQRRSIEVQFVDPGEIRTIRWEVPNGTTELGRLYLEGAVAFYRFAAVPDTPDGFGISGTVSFQGQTTRFMSDGRWVDGAGTPLSGYLWVMPS